MATKVIMPKQGLQMTEGTITRWAVREGQKVEAGQPLFEMETDKLNIEIDAPASGTLLKIIRGEGEVVPITETIAYIGEPGEEIPSASGEAVSDPGEAAAGSKGDRVFITPRAKALAAEKGLDTAAISGSGPDGLVIERDVTDRAAVTVKALKATPLAAKIAGLNGVRLEEVAGTGVNGKITRYDVEAVTAGGNGRERLIPFTGMRKAISDRMMQSLHSMAQANHRMKVDMTDVIRLREKLKTDNVKVTFTDIFVRAVSKALLDFPVVNSTLTPEGILLKGYVNMGLAVAVENGLIVPVIKDAGCMTLQEISKASAELIDRAKKGGLMPEDYTGGTFTITNLGMFDIDEFTAIINPPESAILAIGKIDRVPVVTEGDAISIRPLLTMSLTYDHRVIDGAPAAQFLQRIKQILQNPYLLL